VSGTRTRSPPPFSPRGGRDTPRDAPSPHLASYARATRRYALRDPDQCAVTGPSSPRRRLWRTPGTWTPKRRRERPGGVWGHFWTSGDERRPISPSRSLPPGLARARATRARVTHRDRTSVVRSYGFSELCTLHKTRDFEADMMRTSRFGSRGSSAVAAMVSREALRGVRGVIRRRASRPVGRGWRPSGLHIGGGQVANRPKRKRKKMVQHHQVRSAVAATTALLFALAALAHEVSNLVH
jgi:hypothetical protein